MTYSEVVPLWWSLVWRYVLVLLFASVVLGGIAGVIMAVLGLPEHGGTAGGIVGILTSIPVSMWALKAALSKHNFTKESLARHF